MYALIPLRRVLAARYPVQHGDTLEGICEVLGQPGWRYDELVAANYSLGRKLDGSKSPPSLGYKFPLQVGDQLKIPAHWQPCGPCRRLTPALGLDPKEIAKLLPWFAKSQQEDNELDPQTLELLKIVDAKMFGWKLYGGSGKDLPEAWRPGISNAVVSWWKQDQPNTTPTFDHTRAYADSAAEFMRLHGQHMPNPQSIPWGRIPFLAVYPFFDILAQRLDWGRVQNWLFTSVPVEKVQGEAILPKSSFHTKPDLWADEVMTSIPWAAIPWAKIPWHLIPWSKLQLAGLRSYLKGTPDTDARTRVATQMLLEQLAEAYGVEPPALPPEESKGPPGGRPPGPLKLPKGTIKNPQAPTTYDGVLYRYLDVIPLRVVLTQETPSKIELLTFHPMDDSARINGERPLSSSVLTKLAAAYVQRDPTKAATVRWRVLAAGEGEHDGHKIKAGDELGQGLITLPATAKPGLSAAAKFVIAGATIAGATLATVAAVKAARSRRR